MKCITNKQTVDAVRMRQNGVLVIQMGVVMVGGGRCGGEVGVVLLE